MMHARLCCFALAAALPVASVPSCAEARSGWASGTFVYADLCTVPQTGGIAGRRIVLRRLPQGSGVTVETASGTLGAPVAAASLAIDDSRQEIDFTIAGEGGPVRFRGMAAPTLLAGTLSDRDGDHPLRLRRVLRSHAHEDCRSVPHDPEATASTN